MTLLHRLAEVEALRAEATPGDWTANLAPSRKYMSAVQGHGGESVALVGASETDEQNANAAFIAAAANLDFAAIRERLTTAERERNEAIDRGATRLAWKQRAITAERALSEAKAMIATLESEQQAMQAAIWRWVPHVRDSDAPMDVQAGDDAMLLVGFNGDTDTIPQYGEQLYARAESAERERAELRRELAEVRKDAGDRFDRIAKCLAPGMTPLEDGE